MRKYLDGASAPGPRWIEFVADPIRLGILRTLSQTDEATTADLADAGQASSQSLRRHLEALVSLGVIEEHPARSDGETRGRPAARYSLPSPLRESVRSVLEPRRSPPRGSSPPAQAVSRPRTLPSTRLRAAAGPMNGASAT